MKCFFFAALSRNDKFAQLVGRDIAETTFQSRSGMIKRPHLHCKIIFQFSLNKVPLQLHLSQLLVSELFSQMNEWTIEGPQHWFNVRQTYLLSISVAVSSTQSFLWITIDRFMAVVWSIKFHLISSQVHRIAFGSTWIVTNGWHRPSFGHSQRERERDGRMTCDEEPQSVAPMYRAVFK